MSEATVPGPRPAWAWRLVATVLIGMIAGYAAGSWLGHGMAAVQSAVVAALTFTAGGTGRLRTALPVAAALGAVVVVYSTVGAVTTGHPWAAALAMAAVAFSTSVMTAAKPVGLLIGMVASFAYFLITGVGVLAHEAIGKDLGEAGLLGAIGLATGLLLVALRGTLEQAIGTAPQESSPTGTRPDLIGPMVTSVRTFDDTAKDGVRRAIALGLAMLAFQWRADHNAFWIMLTVFVILQPNGRSTVASALFRVLGTFVGVIGITLLTLALPKTLVVGIAVVGMAVSIALSSRSSWLSAAFGAASAAVFVGLPADNITGYAGARLADTLIGAAIALAAGYLLWPKSKPLSQSVPPDLAAQASDVGMRQA
jgi:hypothetical protein